MTRALLTADIAEVFTHMREKGRPETEAQLRHHVSMHEPMPPSNAHLKRNARAKAETFRDPVSKRVVSEEVLKRRAQFQHFKEMAALLGGTLTVVPADDGTRVQKPIRGTPRGDMTREAQDRAWARTKLDAKLPLIEHRMPRYAAVMAAALGE